MQPPTSLGICQAVSTNQFSSFPWGCTPGSTDEEPCGNCGTKTRTCESSSTWGAFGPCLGEGTCPAGDTREQTCGVVGTQTSTCSATTCEWGSWGNCVEPNPPALDGGSGEFVFPRAQDVSDPSMDASTGYRMTYVGYYVMGKRTTSLASATSFQSTIKYNNYLANSYTCRVTYDIYLNGTKIGSGSAGNQQSSANVTLSFPPIQGPTYEIVYVTVEQPSEVGCGALYLDQDVSVVTLE